MNQTIGTYHFSLSADIILIYIITCNIFVGSPHVQRRNNTMINEYQMTYNTLQIITYAHRLVVPYLALIKSNTNMKL